MDHGPGPRELTLYVTGACDAACDFCKRETDAGAENAGTMSPDLVAEVLDRLPHLTSACIAGFGEPLLVPRLGEIVEVLKRRGLYVGLVTNGTRLRRRADEVRDWDLGHVSVSLNAADAAEHAATLRVDAWDEVLAGVRACPARGVRVGGSFVVGRHNVERVPAYLRLAVDLDLRFAHLHNVLPHGGPRDLTFLSRVLREGGPGAARLEAFRLGWERAGELLAERPAARADGGEDPEVSWPALLPAAGLPGPMACQSPFISIGVDARGSVTGCRRVQEPTAAHGSFRDPGAWENQHFRDLRDGLTGRRPAPEACLNCFGRVRG